MDALSLSFETEPDPAIAARLDDSLDGFNLDMTGVRDWQPVA